MKKLSKYRKKSQRKGIQGGKEEEEENHFTQGHNLYALYCGSCDELLIQPLKKTLNQYLSAKKGDKVGNEVEKKKVLKISQFNINCVHFLEIYEYIRKVERGDCRALNLLSEITFDGKQNNIIYKSDEWEALTNNTVIKANHIELRKRNIFLKGCVGQAYGLIKNLQSCDTTIMPENIFLPSIQFVLYLVEQVKTYLKLVYDTDIYKDVYDDNQKKDLIASIYSIENKDEQIASILNIVERSNKQLKETFKIKGKQNSKESSITRDVLYTCNQWKDNIRNAVCTKWFTTNYNSKENNSKSENNINIYDKDGKALITMLGHLDLQAQLGKVEVSFIVRCGSFMYNLHTKASDEDYFICFIHSTRSLLSSKQCSSTFERHIHKVKIEYSGKEIGTFVLELAKGNPRNIEFLFVDPVHVIHATSTWLKLRALRWKFLTRRCINQYFGFINERLHQVEKLLKPYRKKMSSEAEDDNDEEMQIPVHIEDGIAKYFYHAYHKIFELKRIVNYADPIVTYETDSPQFNIIMNIRRTRPLKGNVHPVKLLNQARTLINSIDNSIDSINSSRKKKGLSVRKDEVNVDELMELIKRIRIENIFEENAAPVTEEKLMKINVHEDTFENDEVEHQNLIVEKLLQIEKKLGIKIILACELSSRSLGTSHQASDHDVYCIFVHKAEKYYSIKPSISKNFRMTYAKQNDVPEIDIVGLECSHSFLMMSSNNLTMFELFNSNIIYKCKKLKAFDWVYAVNDTMRNCYDKKALAWSCLNHATSNFKQYICRKELVLKKKYLHIIRRIIMGKYILSCKEEDMVWPLPYSIEMQLNTIKEENTAILPSDIRSKLIEMLDLNERWKLSTPSNKIELFDRFIVKALDEMKNQLKSNISLKPTALQLKRQDSDSKKIKVFRSEKYGLGYWARLPIKFGERLFSIPYEACINYNVTLDDKENSSDNKSFATLVYKKIIESSNIGHDAALALYLIIESRRSSDDSKYYQYLQFLPSKISSPLLWRVDQLEVLQASPTKTRIENFHRTLIDIYKFIITNEVVQSKAPSIIHGKKRLTLKEFKWVVATIWCRSFFLDMKGYLRVRGKNNMIRIYDIEHQYDKNGNKKQNVKYMKPKLVGIEDLGNMNQYESSAISPTARIIIPMLDLLNHNRSVSHKYRFNPKNRMVEFVAATDIDEGDEITMNYGLFSNHDLFLNYGFIDSNNTMNHLHIPMEVRLMSSLNAFQQKILKWRVPKPHVIVSHEGKPIGDTILVLRILTFDDLGGSAYELNKLLDNEPSTSTLLKVKLYKVLHDLCNTTLSMYETTVELDKLELERKHPPWYKLALKIRLEEKVMLKRCMNYSKSQVFG
eukprot:g5150.t1